MPLAGQNTAASEQTILAAWRRDYRLSLALVVAGIVTVAANFTFSFWANSTGNYPTSFWTGLGTRCHRNRRGHVDLARRDYRLLPLVGSPTEPEQHLTGPAPETD